MNVHKFDNPPCLGMTQVFYPPEGTEKGLRMLLEAQAKLVCQDCPYQEPCLQMGLENEVYGIWGGATASELRKIRKDGKITVARVHREVEERPAHPYCGSEKGYLYSLEMEFHCEECERAHATYQRRVEKLISYDPEGFHPSCGTDYGYQLLARRAALLGGSKAGHKVRCVHCRKAHSDSWKAARDRRRKGTN